MSSHTPRHRDRVPRHRVMKAVAISVATVLVVALTGGFFVYRHLEGNITAMDVEDALGDDRPEEIIKDNVEHKPLNVLLLGSDTREGQGNNIGGETPGLSDTTILLHLSANRERAYGVSIPRDSMVERPECERKDGQGTDPGGLSMFNVAYAIGGPACTIKTVESLTDIRVNHFVVIDFNGFKSMVDALGGVPVCVPEEVNDDIGKIYLPAGSYEVKGQQALSYVRLRHGLSENGDIGRMKRQQAFLASMANKAISAGTLLNPVRLYNFLDAATKSLTTDPELASLNKLRGLAGAAQGHRPQADPVPDGAVRVLRAGPQPAPVRAGGRRAVGADPQRRAAAQQVRQGRDLGGRGAGRGPCSPGPSTDPSPSNDPKEQAKAAARASGRRRERPLRLAGAGLRELLDERLGEGGQVVGVPARDQVAVDDDLLVDPGAAGVADVGPQARPRGQGPPGEDARLDQRPGRVADRRHGLPGVEEPAHERHRVLVGAQGVGVGDAAWKHQPVEVGWVSLCTETSTAKVSALSRWWKACTVPASGETSFGVPPASSTACHGSVSSTCSIPSAATRKATVLPWSARDASFVMLFLLCSFFDFAAKGRYRTRSRRKRREYLRHQQAGVEDLTANRTVQVAVTKPLSETCHRGMPGDQAPEPESAGGANEMEGLA